MSSQGNHVNTISQSIRGLTGLSNLQASLSDNQTRMRTAPAVHSEAGNSRVSQGPGTPSERVNDPNTPNPPVDPSRPSNGIPINSWMSNSMQDIEGIVWRRRLELDGLRRDRQLDALYSSSREPELPNVETSLAAAQAASTSQGSLFSSYRSVLPFILGGSTSMVVPLFHDVAENGPESRGSDTPDAAAAANPPSNSSNSTPVSEVQQTSGDGVRHRPVAAAVGEEQSQ